jgi:hypothetical protein
MSDESSPAGRSSLDVWLGEVDLSTYHRSGWGLHPRALAAIAGALCRLPRGRTLRVVEFGSGGSTEFLLALAARFTLDLDLTSFDHHPTHAHPKATMRPLVACTDPEFEAFFARRGLIRERMADAQHLADETRARNTFYDLRPGDLRGPYDLVVLDGPNGNGRSLAFLHLLPHVRRHTIVLIDDFDHYDFVPRCSEVYEILDLQVRYCLDSPHRDRFAVAEIGGPRAGTGPPLTT